MQSKRHVLNMTASLLQKEQECAWEETSSIFYNGTIWTAGQPVHLFLLWLLPAYCDMCLLVHPNRLGGNCRYDGCHFGECCCRPMWKQSELALMEPLPRQDP